MINISLYVARMATVQIVCNTLGQLCFKHLLLFITLEYKVILKTYNLMRFVYYAKLFITYFQNSFNKGQLI